MADSQSLLVVDDDAAMRQMLASLFRERGYPVREAATADDALEQARELEFDAVLSDIKMPGKSGIELAIDNGVHDIQHISYMDERLVERAHARGCTVTPTSWIITAVFPGYGSRASTWAGTSRAIGVPLSCANG